ncbi:hypothetical protein [Bacillus canaveralius]|uniref:hypothetical protein n=1 Tax=Bacillus canaveralius TaxID=1403243 RepID=UPI000F78183E|nr:hypothetical protein [Bacillus canaveralius]RSK52356.1 hypothetical protein EJA13_11585 [Bacillus canaveralius]
MVYENYRDFYQKSLIQIGPEDLNSLKETLPIPGDKITHWLIALEGEPDQKNYYQWKVAVYPADCEGSFDWSSRFYTSADFNCFHKAFDFARSLEKNGKNDKLSSANPLEQIS